ncbi:hypothetical protein GCM10007854_30740 [Algimonas porphyrae]|uniref:Uncharacterized protein n=1 Tax=Algimonas porphyrae TaxID=1128113 RepID=A0ABQ5V5K3_9PROT|nr:hypothetical protein GCM10007854_30740 [Algimonas porphyrae]
MTTGRINQVARHKREPAHRLGEASRDDADRQSCVIRVGKDMHAHTDMRRVRSLNMNPEGTRVDGASANKFTCTRNTVSLQARSPQTAQRGD